jgi:hypothetical protein
MMWNACSVALKAHPLHDLTLRSTTGGAGIIQSQSGEARKRMISP